MLYMDFGAFFFEQIPLSEDYIGSSGWIALRGIFDDRHLRRSNFLFLCKNLLQNPSKARVAGRAAISFYKRQDG